MSREPVATIRRKLTGGFDVEFHGGHKATAIPQSGLPVYGEPAPESPEPARADEVTFVSHEDITKSKTVQPGFEELLLHLLVDIRDELRGIKEYALPVLEDPEPHDDDDSPY